MSKADIFLYLFNKTRSYFCDLYKKLVIIFVKTLVKYSGIVYNRIKR